MANFAKFRASHLRLGRRGENKVCEYLYRMNCNVLQRNYRHGRDEIDIIALDGLTICFVEVKTRKVPLKTRPASGLDEGQKKRIRRAANHYLSDIGNPKLPHRFDLAEVVFNDFDLVEFRYWADSFGKAV
ncbi:MAG TPA: YraN family protein [Victivallales bacterium]|nr:YraN family protein [Victivallales bacterium]